jgi:hypothetical protein
MAGLLPERVAAGASQAIQYLSLAAHALRAFREAPADKEAKLAVTSDLLIPRKMS